MTTTLTDKNALREKRAQVWGRMDAIYQAAVRAEADKFTNAQARDYDALEQEFREVSAQLDALELPNPSDGSTLERHQRISDVLSQPQRDAALTGVGSVSIPEGVSPAHAKRDLDAPLRRGDSMREWATRKGVTRAEDQGLSFGKYIRGIATGDWRDATNEQRALAEGVAASGGFLVPTPLATDLIDRARNVARVFQAGALTVPMESETLKVARVEGDVSGNWKIENDPIASSDMTFGKVELRARTLVALVRASREVIEDAVNLQEALYQSFTESLALKLDFAALYGSGVAPEPLGLKNTPGVGSQSMGANGAAVTNWEPLIDAVGSLWDVNHEPTGIIYSPRTARAVAKFKDTTGQPLRTPEVFDNVPRYQTNQVPNNLTQGTSNVASDAFVGDWRQLLIGIRTQLHIQVLDQRFSDNLQVGFLAYLRADVQPAHPEAFTVIKGITP